MATVQWHPPCCGGGEKEGGLRIKSGVTSVDALVSGLQRIALARDDEGFVVEPQALVALQHLASRVEIAAVLHCRLQSLVLDLRDISRVVPRREKGRGPDR